MPYFILMLSSILLAGGFLALTNFEAKRGARFFEAYRARLDREITRLQYLVEHVDFASFLREHSWKLFVQVGHLLAHLSLQLVRWIERLLTRTVRYFRREVTSAESITAGEARPFVQALSSFKRELEATRPSVSALGE